MKLSLGALYMDTRKNCKHRCYASTCNHTVDYLYMLSNGNMLYSCNDETHRKECLAMCTNGVDAIVAKHLKDNAYEIVGINMTSSSHIDHPYGSHMNNIIDASQILYCQTQMMQNQKAQKYIKLETLIRQRDELQQQIIIEQRQISRLERTMKTLKLCLKRLKSKITFNLEWKSKVCDMSNCAICKEPMSQSDSGQLKCNHAFHSGCIEEWFTINNTCPCCREINDVNLYYVTHS